MRQDRVADGGAAWAQKICRIGPLGLSPGLILVSGLQQAAKLSNLTDGYVTLFLGIEDGLLKLHISGEHAPGLIKVALHDLVAEAHELPAAVVRQFALDPRQYFS